MARGGGGRWGSAALAVLLAAIVLTGGAFAWLRATLPSEPAAILTDAWDWTAAGPVVVPIGDGGPFRAGDRVIAIDDVPMADLAAGAVSPWARDAAPAASQAAVRTFRVVRDGTVVTLAASIAPQPVAGLLAANAALLVYTLVQAGVAGLAWLRRPAEGWRRGFLAGSVANIANAVIWELGLRATDLAPPEPMLGLFLLGVPFHLLFWSSIGHLVVSWPSRADGLLGSRGFVAALYAVPPLVTLALFAAAAAMTRDAASWLGATERVVGLVVLALVAVVLVALADAWRRVRSAADRPLRIVVAGVLTGVLAVAGLTALPVVLAGQALAPRATVAVLGLPLAAVLLVSVFRSRLFEVDVLLASRRRLVRAREEERRRLRRDLHDGLGPMLAAMTLRADLARDLVRDDPDAADAALLALRGDTQAALAEIRRLTRELRPPALDELGLVEAVRQRAGELARPGGGLAITVAAPVALPPLDAAVEVAAYRIALEAITNVVRHAGARRCEVRFAVRGPLVLEVRDDGDGIPADAPSGVGLTSMRERCGELGGRLAVERTSDGWTVVRAILPLGG